MSKFQHVDIEPLDRAAKSIEMTSNELCGRLMKKFGSNVRIVVRRIGGGLRIVNPGDKLKLDKDEFILRLPTSLIHKAAIHIKALNRDVSKDDLD